MSNSITDEVTSFQSLLQVLPDITFAIPSRSALVFDMFFQYRGVA